MCIRDSHNAESIMPYYAKPSAEKSAPQEDFNGNPIELQPYGFAYNKVLDVYKRQVM